MLFKFKKLAILVKLKHGISVTGRSQVNMNSCISVKFIITFVLPSSSMVLSRSDHIVHISHITKYVSLLSIVHDHKQRNACFWCFCSSYTLPYKKKNERFQTSLIYFLHPSQEDTLHGQWCKNSIATTPCVITKIIPTAGVLVILAVSFILTNLILYLKCFVTIYKYYQCYPCSDSWAKPSDQILLLCNFLLVLRAKVHTTQAVCKKRPQAYVKVQRVFSKCSSVRYNYLPR